MGAVTPRAEAVTQVRSWIRSGRNCRGSTAPGKGRRRGKGKSWGALAAAIALVPHRRRRGHGGGDTTKIHKNRCVRVSSVYYSIGLFPIFANPVQTSGLRRRIDQLEQQCGEAEAANQKLVTQQQQDGVEIVALRKARKKKVKQK